MKRAARRLFPSSPTANFFRAVSTICACARAACTLPVIRKDFTLTEYHVLEAAAVGADAILLIVAILDDAELRGLREMAAGFGMAALVEAHSEQELERAVRSGRARLSASTTAT